MVLANTNYWEDGLDRPTHLLVQSLPGRAEVGVIGAGYTGLNAAIRLARAGADVVVLESGQIGEGASSRNGGMVNHGLKAPIEQVFRRYGTRLGRELWDASVRAVELVDERVKETGVEADFGYPGSVELGFTDRDRQRFLRHARFMQRNFGRQLDVLGSQRITEVVGSQAFAAALVDPDGASIDPARYLHGLVKLAAAAGARIVEGARVERIQAVDGGQQLITSQGSLQVDQVLMATNGYTTNLVPQLLRRVVPIGSYIVTTPPLEPDLVERLIPGKRMLWTARRFLNYFRRTPDNRLLMGGRASLSPELDPAETAKILGNTIIRFFPELAGTPLTHSWGGKLGVTFDLVPHIGRIDGIWYALGYGGHGIALSTYLGDQVGGLMAGIVERSPFAEIPHPTRFYYRGRAWFLPGAALLFRALDRFGL